MKKFACALLAGAAGTLLIGSASAMEIYSGGSYVGTDQPLVQNVRLVCNDRGQCFRAHPDRVIIRDSYNYYAPRERYYRHRDWDDGARVGIRAPGVSVGVGVGDRW